MKYLITVGFILASYVILWSQTEQEYLKEALRCKANYELQEGVEACNKALAINSKSIEAYFYRASFKTAMIQKKDAKTDYINYQSAVADYTQVLQLDATYAQAAFFRGGAHSTMGFLDLAIQDYELALSMDQKQPKVYNSLAVCYARTGNPEKGLACIENALLLDTSYAKAYANKGNICDMLGQSEIACQNWKKAIELGYTSAKNSYQHKCK